MRDCPCPAKPKQAADCYDKMDEKYGEITHHRIIVINASHLTRPGNQTSSIQNPNSPPAGQYQFFLLCAEGKQYIARHMKIDSITGIYIQHSVSNDRTAATHGTTVCSFAGNRFERLVRFIFP